MEQIDSLFTDNQLICNNVQTDFFNIQKHQLITTFSPDKYGNILMQNP